MLNSAGNTIDTISGHVQDVVDPTRFVSDMLSSIFPEPTTAQTSRLAFGSDPGACSEAPQCLL